MLDYLFADWEYGILKEAWDSQAPTVETMTARLGAFNSVNTYPHAIAFHWTTMFNVGDLITAKQEVGRDKKKMMNWVVLQAFKRDNRQPRQVTFSTDLVIFMFFLHVLH